jgi:tetraacyldisaccharide 4'-kinase
LKTSQPGAQAAPVPGPLGSGLATLTAGAWQVRRHLYEWGVLSPEKLPVRVVSIGNLTVGGAGKTTLVLHLAARLRAAGVDVAVVTRRYRPGPGGRGDEELLYRAALGPERTFAGKVKRELARAAAASGARLVLVDDGFSHWSLARDLDVVLLDRTDPWGGGQLLPAGRLREPIVSLQRASVVVVTRLAPGEDPASLLAEVRQRAPSAWVAAARHVVAGVRTLDGAPHAARERSEPEALGPARVLTATGNPEAVAASAREAGFAPVTLVARRDHHWFSREEATREQHAAAGGALLLTAKDAVRWPEGAPRDRVLVLETAWQWVSGGVEVERMVREPRL